MELEFLLAMGCLFGNGKGCESIGEAYYHYAKLDDIAKNVEREYPRFIFASTLLSSVAARKAQVPVYGGINFGIEPDSKYSNSTNLLISYSHKLD